MANNNVYQIIKSVYADENHLNVYHSTAYQYLNAVYMPELPAIRVNLLNGDSYWLPLSGGTISGDVTINGELSAITFTTTALTATTINGQTIYGNIGIFNDIYSGSTNLLDLFVTKNELIDILNNIEVDCCSESGTSNTEIIIEEVITLPGQNVIIVQDLNSNVIAPIINLTKRTKYVQLPNIITTINKLRWDSCLVQRICGPTKSKTGMDLPREFWDCYNCVVNYIITHMPISKCEVVSKCGCGCKKTLTKPGVVKKKKEFIIKKKGT